MEVEETAVWYEGDVASAVSLVKQNKGTLIVLVYRDGHESEKVVEQWENAYIRLLLSGRNYVALKLQQGSPAAVQFCSIYPVLSYPSIYFIRSDGGVLDVMMGSCNLEDLQAKIRKFVEQKSPANIDNTNSACPLPNPDVQSKSKGLLNDVVEVGFKGSQAEDLSSKPGACEAKQMLKEIRAKKAEEERLREQLRKQIEADRREKNLRYEAHKEKEKDELRKRVVKKKADELKRPESTHARIQCRFPNGDRLEEVFDKTEKLSAVYDAVRSSMEKPCDFKLICLFSRHEYSSTDLDKSLEELELNPSAVLLVATEPKAQSIVGVNPISQIFNLVHDWLLNPAWRMVSSVVGWFFPFVMGSSSAGNDAPRREADSSGRRRGGFSRHSSDGGDDDSNAVWNGNSTQQL